jgi:alkylation response protein AidB-like acyl-CoA dehydrogenase
MWQLTAEQQQLRDRAREVARTEIRPTALEVPDCCEYPEGMFKTLARERLLGMTVPREYGGRGEADATACIAVEELARVSGTASLMAAYVTLVTLPILLAGTEEQKRRFLPPLASGDQLGSYALTEPEVGSNPADLETRAERRGDRWLINGQKRFIGNAGLAGTYVVFARTGDPGSKGLSAFLVPGDAPGLTNEPLRTMGMPGWQLGAPRFTDVEVPADHLLGREGDGFKIAMMTFDRSRPTVAAQSVGLAQGAVDLALDYALRRQTFGRPLFQHQGIQFKLAELEAQIAAARALTHQAAAAVDRDDPELTKLAAMAKLLASEAAMRATTEAVQVLGGNGYLKDYPAERMMRDAKVLEIYEGANEIQKLVIARQMALSAAERRPIWPECMPAT